jgi:hypothetical protein
VLFADPQTTATDGTSSLTGIAAIAVPIVAAGFVGVGKLVSLYMAGKKEIAEAVATKTISDLSIQLATLQVRYDALLERYADLKNEKASPSHK